METRTNIVLDDALVHQAMLRAGVKTKKAAIEAALKAYIRKPDYSAITALRGSGVLADDYDPNEAYAQHSGFSLLAAEAPLAHSKRPAKRPAKRP
jgi:Arc/MetJ family transcription regulator